MSHSHRRHKRFKLRSLYVWHRYMGLAAAVFVLILAVTGLLLNHTDDFDFDSRFVKSDWILDWYGITAPEQIDSYTSGGHRVSLLGTQLYHKNKRIPGDFNSLAGAALLDNVLVVAAGGDILLLTEYGELIERLQRKDGVPANIRQLGIDPSGIVLARSESGIVYQSDKTLSRWSAGGDDSADITWIQPAAPQAEVTAALQQRYRSRILPVERVMLDLHSGRLFGRFGVWLFDIAALILILLALSGCFIWLKRKR